MPKNFRESTQFPSANRLLSRQMIRMVDSSRRGRVGLGLIGLGPSWERVYRNALLRLQNRLTIRVVFDPVEARARSVASEFNAVIAGSLYQLLHNTALQGLLVLDPGWCGTGLLNLIARGDKPVFVGSPVLKSALESSPADGDHTSKLALEFVSSNDLVMPELGLRFTPASCRLRELMATKLGAAQKIEIRSDLSADFEHLVQLVDWCSNLLGDDPRLRPESMSSSSERTGFELEFPASTQVKSADRAKTAKFIQHEMNDSPWRIEVQCERGRATLENRIQIDWQTSTDSAAESLTDERTETEILIDQFCRRALGGLIPVGQLNDLRKAAEIARSVQRSR